MFNCSWLVTSMVETQWIWYEWCVIYWISLFYWMVFPYYLWWSWSEFHVFISFQIGLSMPRCACENWWLKSCNFADKMGTTLYVHTCWHCYMNNGYITESWWEVACYKVLERVRLSCHCWYMFMSSITIQRYSIKILSGPWIFPA